jgi:hypothetical protein
MLPSDTVSIVNYYPLNAVSNVVILTANKKRPDFISGRFLFFRIKEKDKPVQVPFF